MQGRNVKIYFASPHRIIIKSDVKKNFHLTRLSTPNYSVSTIAGLTDSYYPMQHVIFFPNSFSPSNSRNRMIHKWLHEIINALSLFEM